MSLCENDRPGNCLPQWGVQTLPIGAIGVSKGLSAPQMGPGQQGHPASGIRTPGDFPDSVATLKSDLLIGDQVASSHAPSQSLGYEYLRSRDWSC